MNFCVAGRGFWGGKGQSRQLLVKTNKSEQVSPFCCLSRIPNAEKLCTEGPESPGKRGRSLCARGGLVSPRACPSPQEMLPDPRSVSSAGSRVGGYDDTSSDHSPANAADPPATSANSPAAPSPAPTAAGTHASTGNCRLRSRSRGPGRHWRASLPMSSWESSCPPLGVCTSEQPRSEMN